MYQFTRDREKINSFFTSIHTRFISRLQFHIFFHIEGSRQDIIYYRNSQFAEAESPSRREQEQITTSPDTLRSPDTSNHPPTIPHHHLLVATLSAILVLLPDSSRPPPATQRNSRRSDSDQVKTLAAPAVVAAGMSTSRISVLRPLPAAFASGWMPCSGPLMYARFSLSFWNDTPNFFSTPARTSPTSNRFF